MQVIGLCRFSYPAIGGFRLNQDTIEDQRRFLYAADRMAERFRLFETITLPGFRAQTDEAFELLLLTGTCLPTAFSDRLRDLTAQIKQIRIIERDPADHKRVMREVLNTARTNPDEPCIQFRHDDDDAVSVDFIESLRSALCENAGLVRQSESIAIDYNNGYVARCDKHRIQVAQVYRSLLGVGLGMFVQGGSKRTIFDRLHNRLARFMPVVSYPDVPMWLRMLHAFNDSDHARKDTCELLPLTPEQTEDLRTRFSIDPDTMKRTRVRDC
ncbi:putative rhamnosyl transferase [Ruegeria sp. 6PALISEP08]|uniref:putative rhamnosyl transferase n=1 Tax=Ruegeria sp. 6PALISEP08 TaxID=1225660 RepID=UPI00067EFD45|nr:putative rhamnosyl transferase [Ruegeria sp. 6PALISEP08]